MIDGKLPNFNNVDSSEHTTQNKSLDTSKKEHGEGVRDSDRYKLQSEMNEQGEHRDSDAK